MKYPTIRYGNPREFQYWAMGVPLAQLARRLRRSERSVRDWLSGRERVPWWVPEILRLQDLERDNRLREMGMGALPPRLGVVSAEVITFPRLAPAAPDPAVLEQEPPVDKWTLPLFAHG